MKPLAALSISLVMAFSASAFAQDASGSATFSTSEGTATEGTAGGGDWFAQYLPEPHLVEIGIYLGAFFPSSRHNFHLEDRQHQKLKSVAPAVGLRLGYFPLTFLGGEVEGGLMPTKVDDGTDARGWTVRGHLVGQLPMWRLVPFAVIGGGRMGFTSDALGDDGDPLFHFGVGAKLPVTRHTGIRLDLRDNLTQKTFASDGTLTHHPEVLFSITHTFGRSDEAAPPPSDRDGDGFMDPDDRCPDQPGIAPDGCPAGDRDGDGIMDPDDKCPDEPGLPPTGCPVPDTDGDGIKDDVDKCPTEKGDPPDGCPNPDPDGDGIIGDADKCPTEPETKNGFEDADGCPDQLPDKVKKFTGVIRGIEFALNKATIRAKSKPLLNEAVAVLQEYKDLRIMITGHTDSQGTREHNLGLSQRRAAAVKDYMVGKGVADNRIETDGKGPDMPLDSNDTKDGRARNRRVEFKLIQK